jgi:hypothetical protein
MTNLTVGEDRASQTQSDFVVPSPLGTMQILVNGHSSHFGRFCRYRAIQKRPCSAPANP